jgi:hypothetical protein
MPLAAPYYDFVYHDEDFISAVGSRSSFFQGAIQDYVSENPDSLISHTIKVCPFALIRRLLGPER